MNKSILSLAVFGAVAVSAASGQIPPGYEIVQITDDPDYDGPGRSTTAGRSSSPSGLTSQKMEKRFLSGTMALPGD